jgi:acetolactate synthase regulatory subunit
MVNAVDLSVVERQSAIQGEIAELHRSVRLLTEQLRDEAIEGCKAVSRHRGDNCPPMNWLNGVQQSLTILADLSRAIPSLESQLQALEAE